MVKGLFRCFLSNIGFSWWASVRDAAGTFLNFQKDFHNEINFNEFNEIYHHLLNT